MTKRLIETLESLSYDVGIVERRFSRTIQEIGTFNLYKVTAAISLVARLAYALARRRPSVVIFFCTNRPTSFLADCALALVLRIFRVRVINYIHTQGYTLLAERSRLWSLLVRNLLTTASETVCLSPILAMDIERWMLPSRISIIPNTPGEVPRSSSDISSEGGRDVLFLSNLLPEKGIEAFVDMAIRLGASNPNTNFRVVGATSDQSLTDRLRRKAQGSHIGHRILFAGPADEGEKWASLSAARVLVFPSMYRYEAQPLTIIESMAIGTPVVAYATGGIPDIIEDGVSGLLVEPGDEQALESATRSLIENADLHKRLRKASAARFESDFSGEAFSRAWKGLIEVTEAR